MGRNSHLFAALNKVRTHLDEQMSIVEYGECVLSYAQVPEEDVEGLVKRKMVTRFYKEEGFKSELEDFLDDSSYSSL